MGVTLQLLYLHNQSRSEENNDLLVNHLPKREEVQRFFICLFFNDVEAIRVAITGHDRQDHPTEEGYSRKRGGVEIKEYLTTLYSRFSSSSPI